MIPHQTLMLSALLTLPILCTHAVCFESGPRQTALIELYTSEGCSSCPPAEERMNRFADHKGLWTEFVPVAFHVDYWNDLGWPDRFSKPEYSRRQRQYSKEWKAGTIYTPCFVENGKATRSPNLKATPSKPGKLIAEIDGETARIRFIPIGVSGNKLTVWLASLSGEERSEITRGENRGRTLDHRFVALDLNSSSMIRKDESFTAELPVDQNAKAVAVWISTEYSLKPIQATGGWLE